MTDHRTRSGSLQFWPRKRARKALPSVNWRNVEEKNSAAKSLLGFIGYKVGMVSVYVKDNSNDSRTKSKRIVIPATVIECPELKIYSVRFYKDNKPVKDVIVGFDETLKSKLKKPKQVKKLEEELGKIGDDYDDVHVLVYSDIKKTGLKKSADIAEVGLKGSKEEKLNFIKEKIGKSISISEVFDSGLVDIRAVSKGYGTQGPVKRFGITLKAKKSEKGQRRPGSLGPWHPARVSFRVPMMGQTGFHNRISHNNIILKVGKISEEDINKKSGFHKYGNIKTDYVIVKGSLPGTRKRQLLITDSIRSTKKKAKQDFEVIEIR